MKNRLAVGALASVVAGLALAAPAQAAGTYQFSCSIGRLGQDPCGSQITVPNGEILRVNLVSSGGKSVSFCARNAENGDDLGCTANEVNPGAAETTIWQNGTGNALNIQVYADADDVVNTVANGNFRVAAG